MRSDTNTAGSDRELERAQLHAYAADVRNSYLRELRRSQELKESYLATVKALAAAVEAKDGCTGGHIHRVHGLGLQLAEVVIPEQVRDAQLAFGFHFLETLGDRADEIAAAAKGDSADALAAAAHSRR